MGNLLTKKIDKYAITQLATYIDEVLVDERKGIAQERYVMEIKPDAKYLNDDDVFVKAPSEMVGTWMLEDQTSLMYLGFTEALRDYDWVKCKEVEVVTTEWVKAD